MFKKFTASGIFLFATTLSGLIFFNKTETNKHFPRPADTQINFRNEEGEERGGYEKYKELTRSLALGPDWREIGRRNMEEWERRVNSSSDRTSYAGGLLQGTFYERGCSNITGSISVFDLYDDEWYCLGSTGSIWKPPRA